MTIICPDETNKKYFIKHDNNNYKISNEVFGDQKKLLKFDEDTITLAADYFSEKPTIEHCYRFGLEKWHDWFTIPYYYLTNKIESQELKDIYETTWSQGNCYNKCSDDNIVAISGNKTKCINIKNFKGGKYNNLLPYDPIALISLLGNYNKYKRDIEITFDTGDTQKYSYENILWKYKYDSDIRNNNNNNIKDLISIIDNNETKINYYKNNILIPDMENAIKIVLIYIRDLIDETIRNNSDLNENKELDKTIFNIIENDLNQFYYLFDNKDEYYMDYLTKKINYSEKLKLGKYCGAQASYKLANETKILDEYFTIPAEPPFDDIIQNTDNELNNIYIKCLKHIYKYSIELCFTKNYRFYDGIRIYKIIDDVNAAGITDTNPANEDKTFNSNNNIKIKKEIYGSFNNYEYVFKYYNSLPTIAYLIVLFSAVLMFFYYICYSSDLLHYLAKFINIIVFLIIYVPTLLLYGIILLFLFIANITIFLPLSFVISLYNRIKEYFKVLLLILLIVIIIMSVTINGRKIVLDMIMLAWKLFITIMNLIIDIIIWILKQPIIVSLIIIYSLYLLYSITSKDLELLIERHLDFYIKRNLIELRISQFLINFIKNGNDYFAKLLFKYNIDYKNIN